MEGKEEKEGGRRKETVFDVWFLPSEGLDCEWSSRLISIILGYAEQQCRRILGLRVTL